jgi:phosphatidylserine decarboxylase precursor
MELLEDTLNISGLSPIMIKLVELIVTIPGWYDRFNTAINTTLKYNLDEFNDVHNLNDWLYWCNNLLYWIPTETPEGHNLDYKIGAFYFVLNQPSVRTLQNNSLNPTELTPLAEWIVEYAQEWGKFLDTTESLTEESLQSFYNASVYHMYEYMPEPSGWKTFNQFFARRVKPGYRPISNPNDNHVIVSVADSTFQGWWHIDNNAQITVKNIKWSIYELLYGNPYAEYFKGGVFMHAYLSPTDYHRFHTPISGKVLYSAIIRGQASGESAVTPTNIPGKYKFEIRRGKLVDPVGYQFYQTRGVIILNTEFGLIAVMPIGMSLVSSVIINAEPGVNLLKGEEFGYFQCGGSDYIILFQRGINVNIFAKLDNHYNQGTSIAHII